MLSSRCTSCLQVNLLWSWILLWCIQKYSKVTHDALLMLHRTLLNQWFVLNKTVIRLTPQLRTSLSFCNLMFNARSWNVKWPVDFLIVHILTFYWNKLWQIISRHIREALGIEEPCWDRRISLHHREPLGLFLERKCKTGVESDALTLEDFYRQLEKEERDRRPKKI